MRLCRLYTGDDGKSHIEEINLSFQPGALFDTTLMQPAKGVMFNRIPRDYFQDFHCAPRRQYIVVLSSIMEIGLGDGSLHRFGPGDVVLVEDVTGQGHTSRTVGDADRISMTIPLE